MEPNCPQFGDFSLDLASSALRRGGEDVPLAALPARLLRHLALNRHRTVSHEELTNSVWRGVAVEEARSTRRSARRAGLSGTTGDARR